MSNPVAKLVTTKSDAELAAELKERFAVAMGPVLELFDEAAAAGLAIQFDGINRMPPNFRHLIVNPRVVKIY
jgi:hypothetical protein